LGYQDPYQVIRYNVPPEERKSWEELDPGKIYQGQVPSYWKPNTVFISEAGLYRLLCRSTKPEAVNFEKWVFDEVLPTLRETGAYTMTTCNFAEVNFFIKSFEMHLKFLTEQLVTKDQQLAVKEQLNIQLQEKVFRLYEKVALITYNNETKHVFQLYKHLIKPNKYLFIRTQCKYLPRVMKAINLEKYHIFLNEVNLPSSMNILNRLKEKLSGLDIPYKASKNTLEVSINILDVVQELLQEPQT
jgi:prophage antirepressor-like protein